MPLGKYLTDFERGQIQALAQSGAQKPEIAKTLGRSITAVTSAINLGDNYGNWNRGGRPKVTTDQDDRKIARLCSTGGYSIREIQPELPIEVSRGTIHNRIKASDFLVYTKKKCEPPLKPVHIEKRLEYARKYMHYDREWEKVVFSGGSLMVWGAYGYHGKSELATISHRLNSQDYQGILQDNLLRAGPQIGGRGWIFQQDNASIHVSNSTQAWLDQKRVRRLDHPPKSPDLNPMENLWGIMARNVYAHGKQYANIRELELAIHAEWAKIPLEVLQTLTDSMKNRIFEVILNQGEFIHY
ncbi:Transposable element Tc3 transposase [Folsomia candida]|uniref:Transposable element Tc3 transposase n=1 Tax=Folsomia candida TaxID=158441 RepID=A0A226CVC0_FOLCA|nr:Transposable element Tc3 transposase [Folsomia candida]